MGSFNVIEPAVYQIKNSLTESLKHRELKLFHQFCILKSLTKLRNLSHETLDGKPVQVKKRPGYTINESGDLTILLDRIQTDKFEVWAWMKANFYNDQKARSEESL